MKSRIHIIGIGDDGLDGLSPYSKDLLDAAEVVIGSPNLLGMVSRLDAEFVGVGGDLQELKDTLEQIGDRPTVMLASGDPLFYGITRFLTQTMGKNRFEIVPHVSSM